jgi:membrane-bound lytic murein transglycosylase B
MLRIVHIGSLLLALAAASVTARAGPNETPRSDASFKTYLAELWTDARARGVTRATFDAAFAGVEPDPRVLAVTKRQPEYGKAIGAYIESFVSAGNLAGGTRKASQWKDTLDAIEGKFGVDSRIILAIWGVETGYGSYKPVWDVIRSLATLAHARYREELFREELLAALLILQEGHVTRQQMLGSWAGAMGQSQFLPTSFRKYAVDFSGDGRADIWTNVPDVLGSIGNYLHAFGWRKGLIWGFEVVVPKGFDYRRSRATFAQWAALGVKRADSQPLTGADQGILFFPSGAQGPAFLVTENFIVIKSYNNSDAYALAVAHLANRLRGLGPSRTKWPETDPQLPKEDRIELQNRLAALGHKVNKFNGPMDFDLRDSIRLVQVEAGMVPDGHPTAALMKFLRSSSPQRAPASKQQ